MQELGLQEENWVDSIPTVSLSDIKGQRKRTRDEKLEKDRNLLDKPGQHERELNPYWKDGGLGLPSESGKEKSTSSIGDGGLGWLQKSFKRCQEQAQEEGRSLEDIAAERWGSLDKLKSLIKEAEEKVSASQESRRNRESDKYERHRNSKDDRHRHRERSRSRSRERERHSRKYDDRRDERSSHKYDDKRYRREERNRGFAKPADSDDDDEPPKRNHREERSRGFAKPAGSDDDEPPKRYHREERSRGFTKPAGSDDDEDSRERKSAKPRYEDFPQSKGYSDKPSWKKKEFNEKKPELKTERIVESIASSSRIEDQSSNDRSKSKGSETMEDSIAKPSTSDTKVLTKDEMNALSAKILKAEMLGNTELVKKLKDKLESAKQAPEEETPLSDAEMNALAAKLVKAEIMGNENLVNKLKSKLENARKVRASMPESSTSSGMKRGEAEKVILTKTDAMGNVRPLAAPKERGPAGREKRKKVENQFSGGERARYFYDDDKHDLQKMFELEKSNTAEDQNAAMSRLFARGIERTNEDYDLDDVFVNRAGRKVSDSKLEEMERSKAIEEHKKMSKVLDSCKLCFDSKLMKKHLVLSMGSKVYLALPSHQSLTEGHCQIVPMNHVRASTYLDEDVWEEIEKFRKALTRMFEKLDQDVVFFETSSNFKYLPHMMLECVPVPRDVGDTLPIYFKKALLDCEGEWAENKKVVDLKDKGIRRSIPKGLPYFHVNFAMDSGFAHVLENEKTFPRYFAQEIIGGILDCEPQLWRKPKEEDFNVVSKKVLTFANMWKPFDWTLDSTE